jgi:hypothetical protein
MGVMSMRWEGGSITSFEHARASRKVAPGYGEQKTRKPTSPVVSVAPFNQAPP